MYRGQTLLIQASTVVLYAVRERFRRAQFWNRGAPVAEMMRERD